MRLTPHAARLFRAFTSLMVISLMLLSRESFAIDDGGLRRPCQTGIPAPLRKPKEITPLGCERPFIYRGETYSADSPQAQDASTLKYFVQSVPESNSILEDYQSTREKSKISAYTGTFGILMAIFSNTIAKPINANPYIIRIAGATIATGGFFYSFAILNSNESRIPKAVETYNKSKPNDPIEIQFSTGWKF